MRSGPVPKKPGTFWFFLFLFFIFSFPLLALEIPKRAEGYVSDYAGMLSPAARERLEQTLRQFEADTSNQVVVVTFPSLEGEVLEDFAIRLAEQWKVGQKGKDNGIILLIFKNDRQVRIEVGYGLEGALPDATSKLIIENEIVPNFRQGKFDEGIEKAVHAITAATRGEYRSPSQGFDWDSLFGLLLLLILILANPIFLFIISIVCFLIAVGSLFAGQYLTALFSSLAGGFLLTLGYILGKLFPGKLVLNHSGSTYRRGEYWSSGFGGGGFSGGGGSFGGGGASGRW